MPKIRGIKPDFWTDEDIVELTMPARLLYIGLWNLSCDNGHVPDKPKQIKMRVLPADDVDVDELLSELAVSGRITRVAGTITIPNFAQHQRPHRRWWSTCDLPLCKVPDDAPPQGFTRGGAASKGASQPDSHRGTTGEQPLRNGRPTADVDGEGDGEGEEVRRKSADADHPALAISQPPTPSAQTLVAEWIDHCDQTPLKRTIGHMSREIKSLLDEDVPYAEVRAAVAAWQRKGLGSPSSLPSVVHEMRNPRQQITNRGAGGIDWDAAMQRAEDRDRAQAALEAS